MSIQITTQEEISSKTKTAIIDEAKRIEENCQHTAKGHFEAAQFWANFHLWIGIPAVVLAGIAGATAFAKFDQNNIIAGILSLIVVVLTSISTFLNPKDRSNSYLSAGNNYDSLLTKARTFWTIDCKGEDSDSVLNARLKDLLDQRDKLNRECFQVPRWAYIKAKKGIEAGEATYRVDQKS
jgi:hypothetical protein